MKKIIFSLAFPLFCTTMSFAQLPKFKKNQVDLHVGVGIFSVLDDGSESSLGLDSKLKRPPISVTADFGITDEISLGGYIGTAKSDIYYQDLYQRMKIADVNHFLIGIRGLYHFDLSPKFDTYAGLMLAYNAFKIHSDMDDSNADPNALTYNILVGGRYHFNEHVGAFFELGYGISIINLGLALKFN